jgi:site-specific recombinase XerD
VSAGWIKVYAPGEFRGRPGWHVRGRDQWGRPIEGRLPPTVTTERVAERVAKRLLGDANRRAPTPEPEAQPVKAAPDHSFKAAAHAYRRIRRPHAVDWERIEKLIACPDIGPIPVGELTTDQVATFATRTMPHNAPDTLNREIVTPYSSVLHYAYELKWCGDPMIRRFAEREDEIKAVTPAEVDALIANADATPTYKAGAHGLRDKNAAYKVAFLEYLRLRGTRVSDALALKRAEDLDLPGMRVRLTIGKRRDKVQWLPLSPKVTALFANLAPCDGVYLFPWRSKSGVYKWLTPLCKRLGIKVTPHQFRHALGEEAMDAEVDVLTLMNLGAWASLNSARRYARASRKRLEQADRKRAEAALTVDHREMVAADLEATEPANVLTLKKKTA